MARASSRRLDRGRQDAGIAGPGALGLRLSACPSLWIAARLRRFLQAGRKPRKRGGSVTRQNPSPETGRRKTQMVRSAKCMVLSQFRPRLSINRPRSRSLTGPAQLAERPPPAHSNSVQALLNPGAVDRSKETKNPKLSAQAPGPDAKPKTIDPKRVALTSGGRQANRRHRFRRSPDTSPNRIQRGTVPTQSPVSHDGGSVTHSEPLPRPYRRRKLDREEGPRRRSAPNSIFQTRARSAIGNPRLAPDPPNRTGQSGTMYAHET